MRSILLAIVFFSFLGIAGLIATLAGATEGKRRAERAVFSQGIDQGVCVDSPAFTS